MCVEQERRRLMFIPLTPDKMLCGLRLDGIEVIGWEVLRPLCREGISGRQPRRLLNLVHTQGRRLCLDQT